MLESIVSKEALATILKNAQLGLMLEGYPAALAICAICAACVANSYIKAKCIEE